ncbi:MAG: MBL fold metallo-hydrolase [Candidatus Celaenobacter antarcticus]|nr:MBL fold metallo-hydrolase [Candidatus Celaenobacter antarcticus]
MNFKIHRGTQEIGGSCVEIWTDTTRIVLDFGMPLVEKDGSEFDFRKYEKLSIDELKQKGILPNIDGFYDDSKPTINGVIISHPHLDHYGLINFLNPKVKVYLGGATHKIIELTNIFTPSKNEIKKYGYYKNERPFSIGDIIITPFLMDHSAFDAYALLIEANGKTMFYSGDFRGHGRKAKMFKWFKHNAPKNVDYLLMEGTQIGRKSKKEKSESDIETELILKFNELGKINLVYASGQNIDRLVSIFKACQKTGKIFVVDVYVATVLKALAQYSKLPYPSKSFPNIKVIFSKWTSNRLAKQNLKQMLYRFKYFKITKKEIGSNPSKYVMVVRPSMKIDLQRIKGIDGGNLIYSMWDGYLKKKGAKDFIDYLKGRNFAIFHIHSSGHADLNALKQMVNAVDPKTLIPIHTFNGKDYKNIFKVPVKELKDGEILSW